jgi:hypothetical protein
LAPGPARVEAGALYQAQHDELRGPVRIGDAQLSLLLVQNSTPEPDGSFKHYILRVPPVYSRPRDAVAWTFGLQPHEYDPGFES